MSGIYHNGKRIGSLVSLTVQDASGEFVPITPLSKNQTRRIVCSPVPGRDGIEYVPDWYGLGQFE